MEVIKGGSACEDCKDVKTLRKKKVANTVMGAIMPS